MDAISNFLPLIGILAGAGTLAGFLAGLLGVGGGIIFVPVYYFLFIHYFDMSQDDAIMLATSTSLATMIPTSMSSCLSHIRNNNYLKDLVIKWLPFLMLGVLIGKLFSYYFGGNWLTLLFGAILLFAAFNMMFFAKAKGIFENLPSFYPWQSLMATTISTISVMLGIGGGTLTVPNLTLFKTLDTKKVVGTASIFGFLICLPGALITIIADIIEVTKLPEGVYTNLASAPTLTFGQICYSGVLCILPFSVLMAPIGAKVNRMLPPHVIKIAFGILMIFTSAKMLMSGLGM